MRTAIIRDIRVGLRRRRAWESGSFEPVMPQLHCEEEGVRERPDEGEEKGSDRRICTWTTWGVVGVERDKETDRES